MLPALESEMADNNNGGDKTEKPTAKRLLDARKKGDVAKSKDLSSAIGMVAWFVLALAGTGFIGSRIAGYLQDTLTAATHDSFENTAVALGWSGLWLVLLAGALTLIPAALVGLAGEFLQVGAMLTTEKLKPGLEKLNPIAGFQKMFSLDNLFELIKTLIKAVLILGITCVVMVGAMDKYAEILGAAGWSPLTSIGPSIAAASFDLMQSLTMQLIAGTFGVFLLVAFADRVWTQQRFTKKLMMSRRDIRQEHKDNEGDPMLKGQRKQMHEEWANQNAVAAAGTANVLLTNPTHLAIALDYDPHECPVPVIAAKGEGPLAAAMRARAEEEGVPIVRNVPLARTIWSTTGVNELVPQEHFDAIAEIILWAKQARDGKAPREREDVV
jgi:flagellar biosynthesis protein FlhB